MVQLGGHNKLILAPQHESELSRRQTCRESSFRCKAKAQVNNVCLWRNKWFDDGTKTLRVRARDGVPPHHRMRFQFGQNKQLVGTDTAAPTADTAGKSDSAAGTAGTKRAVINVPVPRDQGTH